MALSVPRLLPTKTYPFSDLRHALAATGIQAGVAGAATEFKVTQDTGSNMNVKIAAGDSGAWVTGLDTTRQGAYHVYNDAIITTAVSAANATNPRIDQVVLRVYDSTVIGGGTDAAAIEVIAGTATSGATLDNRTGAANLATIAAPKTLIRLADILVPATSTAVTNANIRDRRPWATGAQFTGQQTTGAAYTTSSGSVAAIDTTNLSTRIECGGGAIETSLEFGNLTVAAAPVDVAFELYDNGVFVSRRFFLATSTSIMGGRVTHRIPAPTVGSHLLELRWWISPSGAGQTATLSRDTTYPLIFAIRETLGGDRANT